MFTGIVEETGIVKNFSKNSTQAVLTVECKLVLEETKLGDSICINGVCQTVTEITPNSFTVEVSEETLHVTNFLQLKTADTVNLERALTLSSRLGGHIVSGHVDCCAKLLTKQKSNEFYNLEIEIPEKYSKYVIKKGSITLNGISLTVADIQNNKIRLAIIPHTFENTNLSTISVGDNLNIEFDQIGKYIEKFLNTKNTENKIDIKFLQENGFV